MNFPKAFAVLGNAIAMVIEYNGILYEHTWPEKGPARMVLMAGTSERAAPEPGNVLLLTKPRPHKKVQPADYGGENAGTVSNAISTFEKFADRHASVWSKISIPNFKLKRFGKVISLSYYSNKWGRKDRYIHTFKNQPLARINYTSNGINPPIIMVSGSKIQITKRGIEG